MRNAQESRRILLLMHPWVGYLQDVQLGVAKYLAQRPHWLCTRMTPLPELTKNLASWKFDGAIVYIEPSYTRVLRKLSMPVVDVSNWAGKQHFPRVTADDASVGRMAAEHLMEIGLRHYAVVGFDSAFSATRREGFVNRLEKAGFSTLDFSRSSPGTLPAGVELPAGISAELAAWLLGLPKPTGCFATSPGAAEMVLEACSHLRVRVPEDLCVISGDDDELTVNFTKPPFSSIVLPAQKIGFEAARLLDDLMAGKPVGTQWQRLPPVGIITRQSTNLLAISDPDVLAAVRYMREHLHEGVNVDRVLERIPINRRYLERKFKKQLGMSPLQQIRQLRLQKAKELLSGSDFSIPTIARRSGFPNGERLAQVFRDAFGVTPTEYRRQFRLHD